jgi:hypothetical protein
MSNTPQLIVSISILETKKQKLNSNL